MTTLTRRNLLKTGMAASTDLIVARTGLGAVIFEAQSSAGRAVREWQEPGRKARGAQLAPHMVGDIRAESDRGTRMAYLGLPHSFTLRAAISKALP